MPRMKNPVHIVAPRIGIVVQGLLIKFPNSKAGKFKRNAQAKKIADMVCNPYVGLKAMNTPQAKARAVRCGDSSRWSTCFNCVRMDWSEITIVDRLASGSVSLKNDRNYA